MSKILKGVYHGKDTEILELGWVDEMTGTTFLVRCADFDIVVGFQNKIYCGDIENVKKAFKYFNSLQSSKESAKIE